MAKTSTINSKKKIEPSIKIEEPNVKVTGV
jgi:hypothetical protein